LIRRIKDRGEVGLELPPQPIPTPPRTTDEPGQRNFVPWMVLLVPSFRQVSALRQPSALVVSLLKLHRELVVKDRKLTIVVHFRQTRH
jgi:hypothetical protein